MSGGEETTWDEWEEWEEEEEEEEEEWQDEATPPRAAAASREVEAPELQRGLALGFLALAPLLVAYEFALISTGGARRNTSELMLHRVFELFGAYADPARRVVIAGLVAFALVHCLERAHDLLPRIARIALEGLAAAILLGPVLIVLVAWLADLGAGTSELVIGGEPRRAPSLARAGLVIGAGAYEEIVFRLGLFSALYVAIRRGAHFLGAGEGFSRGLGEAAGLLGSSLAFAAIHMSAFVGWLGQGGDKSFELETFLYRVFAGLLFGVLFLFRGLGVAAWTHAFFNLALLLGAGPDVLLASMVELLR